MADLSFLTFVSLEYQHTCFGGCVLIVFLNGEGRRVVATVTWMLMGTWSCSLCGRGHIWWLVD